MYILTFFGINQYDGITVTAPTRYTIVQMMKNRNSEDFDHFEKSYIYNINAMNRCTLI